MTRDCFLCQNIATCAVVWTNGEHVSYLFRCDTCLSNGIFSRTEYPIVSIDEYYVWKVMNE